MAQFLVATQLIGNRCYCGNSVASPSVPVPDFYCGNVCSGDKQSVCGGRAVLSLYEVDYFDSTASLSTLILVPNSTTKSTNLAPPRPPAPQPSGPPKIVSVPGWTYRGCWTDNPYDRTLISKRWKGYITPESCAKICKGFQYFGLEYSNE